MEVSALRYSGGTGLHGRSPLLRLQSDERLVTLIRRGNQSAFEVLVSRYHSRLLSFCRHLLGSREDAEDVLQDVLTASYNAMLADDRPINVRPWLYRIARNRCLNHLRRNKPIGVDSMDIHFSDHGASTADKVHDREEFRQLLDDIRDLPETQRTALILREMDALSYEQIAEAMETTVSSVKSLLVRARVSLTEAAEARLLSCDEVREELAEVAEGMRRKTSASVRRHVKNCTRCELFQGEMRKTNKALAALMPIGPVAFLHKLLLAAHIGHSAGSAGAAGAGAAGAAGTRRRRRRRRRGRRRCWCSGRWRRREHGLITAGVGAVATKAAAGLAAAALVTAGTVAVSQSDHHHHHGPSASTLVTRSVTSGVAAAASGSARLAGPVGVAPPRPPRIRHAATARAARAQTTQTTAQVTKTSVPAKPVKTAAVTRTTATVASSTPAKSVVRTPPTATTPAASTATATTTTPGVTGGVAPLPPTTTSTTPVVSQPTTTTPTTTPTTTSTTPTTTTTTSTTPTITTHADDDHADDHNADNDHADDHNADDDHAGDHNIANHNDAGRHHDDVVNHDALARLLADRSRTIRSP